MPKFNSGDRVKLVVSYDELRKQGLSGHQIREGQVVTVTKYHNFIHDAFYIDLPYDKDGDNFDWVFRDEDFELVKPEPAMTKTKKLPKPTLKALYESLLTVPDATTQPLAASRTLGVIIADLDDSLLDRPVLEDSLDDKQDILVSIDNAVVGMNVRRGPDWKWGNQDKQSIGQIMSITKGGFGHIDGVIHHEIRVKWADQTSNTYRGGPIKHDLVIAN